MNIELDKFDDKERYFLKKISQEINDNGNFEHAFRDTVAVFQVVRDVVDPEDSKELISRLPSRIGNIIREDWDEEKSRVHFRKTEDFYEAMREKDELAAIDFPDNTEAKQAVQAVIKTLREVAGKSVVKRIQDQLPRNLKAA